MKYIKTLALLAVIGAASAALVGTASATILTSPTGTVYTGTIEEKSQNGHVVLHSALGTVECTGFVDWKVETHGSGVTVKGNNAFVGFTGCTGNKTVNVKAKGSTEVHWTSGYDGTITSSGTEIEVFFHGELSGSCIYTTNNTKLGTLTGGSSAVADISGTLPRTGGSLGVFCGSTGTITGSWKITNPTSLYVDP